MYRVTFYRSILYCFLIWSNLSEGALSNKRVDLVAVQPLLPVFYNVIIVVVVVAVVVHFALFFGAGVLRGNLLGSPFLLCVIHLESQSCVLNMDKGLLTNLDLSLIFMSFLIKDQLNIM